MTQPPHPTAEDDRFGAIRPWLAPTLALVGLLIVAFLTLSLMNGSLPFVGGSGGSGNGTGNGTGNGNGGGGPILTPAPSNVVVVPVPEVTVPGSIVYAKAGNIWIQTGKQAHQLTGGGHDSMPSWSPDGKDIYFIRTTDEIGIWPSQGVGPPLPDDGPGRHARQGRRQRGPGRRPRRAHLGRESRLVLVDPPARARSRRQDARDGLGRSGSDEERRRAPVLRPAEEEADRSRPSPRSRRSATRTRRGGRTARCSSTSATAAKGRAAHRSSTAGTWPRRRRRR